MLPSPVALLSNSSAPTSLAIALPTLRFITTKPSARLRHLRIRSSGGRPPNSAVASDSLRLLEWDKLCDSVASFAGTPLGRDAAKEQLLVVNVSYEESRRLLEETAAAVEMINYGTGGMDFAGLDILLVQSAIDRASRGLPIDGLEAMAGVSLVQFAENLQMNVKTAVKEDADWFNRFMPLSQVIMNVIISQQFVKSVQQVIHEDGSVKDNASSELKRSRDQVKVLEKKLSLLMDKLLRTEKIEASSLEVCAINGRWCIKSAGQFTAFDGLLLPSATGVGGVVEPIAAVPLNDELQQARASVAKAEEDVLSRLTDKLVAELDGFRNLFQIIIWLDSVTARAKYSIAFGGTYPDLFLPGGKDESFANIPDNMALSSPLSRREWKLYMPKAYHPMLLQQHRENLRNAKQDLANASAERRRRKMQGKMDDNEDYSLTSMKTRIAELENDHPVPVDFMVSSKIKVLVITGPNTGGKTISLKTVGIASLMAKTGLYVLASEPVKIPWFDAIYADIGDEQSLTQSLSTFSGHLKQISAIRSQSSIESLVLMDEVGAGTNPLEGAALGMSLLESFAANGSFLTIATTHHGELKTLKYSNRMFENACVEFDEESLKPTFKILWGVPGRSNAINIAKRLGLPSVVLDSACNLHGAPSAEINGVIIDMERCKHDFQHDIQEAHRYLMLSRKLHEDLLIAKQKIRAHRVTQRIRKVKAISETAAVARCILRNKLQQFRESAATCKTSPNEPADKSGASAVNLDQTLSAGMPIEKADTSYINKPAHEKQVKIPEVGDMVLVPSLGKQAKVLKVDCSKGELLVQASNLKLRLKLSDLETQHVRTI